MVFLYASTIFLSAFLLFQVQPIIGKMILPWFGGSAAVWSTCMLVFQGLLLLGYLYAHLTTRYLTVKKQTLLHISLLLISLMALPITPDPAWKPRGDEDPAILIIGLMAASVGLPYFLLSTTGPLVQFWFAKEKPGSIPYRLFALSNFGSMLGLISYPLLFEPLLAIPKMSSGWSAGYSGFTILCGALALRSLRTSPENAHRPLESTTSLPAANVLMTWAALAAIPAILLMTVTSYLTQNIAPVPLLWVVPLVIYLISFILCFEGRKWYNRKIYFPIFIVFAVAMLASIASRILIQELILSVIFFSLGLFVFCMVCHGELERMKPDASRLTSFYLMIAAGGAAGGVFVALIAPRIFNDDYELSITLIAMVVLVFAVIYRDPQGFKARYKEVWLKSMVFGTTLISLLTIAVMVFAGHQAIKVRNFYGTLTVMSKGVGDKRQKEMLHGVITHGMQFVLPEKLLLPTSYYGPESGAGLGIHHTRRGPTQKVGVVGLGVGTIAAYCRPGDQYKFYEINALVTQLAKSEFRYLGNCEGNIEVTHGDARLSLERESANNFDVLILDAFSGDSVPVHLLTREVFATYFRHVKKEGILAVHISNKHLNLVPVVSSAASFYGKHVEFVNSKGNPELGILASQWALISGESLSEFFQSSGDEKEIAEHAAPTKPWTDDYSSIFGILR